MRYFARVFDNRRSDSLATQLRQRRFALFRSLLEQLPAPRRILDVGGTPLFWERMGYLDAPDLSVVLLNLSVEPTPRAHFVSLAGDARAMTMFGDGEFDMVFSNSVIEHMGSLAGQQRMASEVQRVGRHFFVQTPNRAFPLEPHFLFPWFQYLPRRLQIALVQRFKLGWYERRPRREDATALVDEHRLLSASELRALFPRATIYRERVAGLTKSFVAYGGF